MNKMNELRKELYLKSEEQQRHAWNIKNYDKSMDLRKKQKENFEKWRLLDGIIKQNEKECKNGKNE